MRQFINRLTANRPLFAKILIASFLVNILALATPIYVIQVLQRYVAYGVTSTLITLVAGITFIVIFEFFFRNIRHRMAREYELKNVLISNQVLDKLTIIKSQFFETGTKLRNDIINKNLTIIHNVYSASNLLVVVDVPFTAIFLLALFLIHYQLGLIVTIFLIIPFILIRYFRDRIGALSYQSDLINSNVFRIFDNVITRNITLKFFNLIKPVASSWNVVANSMASNRENIESKKNLLSSSGTGLNSFLTISVIAWGATLAVEGQISVGALIGANILASRALMPIIRFSQAQEAISKGDKATLEVNKFLLIEAESKMGREIMNFEGRVSIAGLEFIYPGKKNPTIMNVTLKSNPGDITVITGLNGSGKTTLIKILANIIEPSRGKILIDDIDIGQLSSNWYRSQIAYSPQEPQFIDGTLGENIVGAAKIEHTRLQQIMKIVDLLNYVNSHEKGINMQLDNRGEDMPLGIRKRVGHARSLINDAKLILFDEPTEGLDKLGKDAIYDLLKHFKSNNKTIFVASNDQSIIDISDKRVNLNESQDYNEFKRK